jgi:hypothetical protein
MALTVRSSQMVMSIMHDDQAVFIVATVPPPPGESDAYSAATKLQGPPLAMIAAMMDNVVDLQFSSHADDDEEVVDVELTEEVPAEDEEEASSDVDFDFTVTEPVMQSAQLPQLPQVPMQVAMQAQSQSQSPFALVLAGIVTIVGGAIAAISFLV